MATLVSAGTKHNVYEALRGRHLRSIRDLNGDELASLIALGADIKGRARRYNGVLSETTVSMLFEKPSLRTRVSFDVAAHQLGAHAIYLAPQEVGRLCSGRPKIACTRKRRCSSPSSVAAISQPEGGVAMQPTVLIAIGGNALIRAGEPGTVTAQRTHVADTCRAIADVVSEGWRVVITHGNGPQVGAALLRSERAAGEAYPLPLDVCVAGTQGEIGFLLQQALGEALEARGVRHPVATVLTQVVVAPGDPGFAQPTKPIGPFYSHVEIAARRALGWTMVEEPPHGYRRVVASPEPIEIVEESVIRTLVDANIVVITLGGGGIPVVRNGHRLTGVEAVVDKDLASALLANRLQIDRFILSTDVDRIYLDYGSPKAHGLDDVTTDELRHHAAAGHFPRGTMGPKVEAALRFVEAGDREAIVTSYDRLILALQGLAGTHVFATARAAAHEETAPVTTGRTAP